MESNTEVPLLMGLPKGRIEKAVVQLLSEAGIYVRAGSRTYRPSVSLEGLEAKILKPHDMAEMLALGSRDIGFAGADWVAELELELVELVDTGLDPVRLVAAAPAELLVDGCLPNRRLVVASEFERLTRQWIEESGLDATFVLSRGSTEVFPPEDADCIVDIAATGDTLRANSLVVVDELMTSSTRLFANPQALKDPQKRKVIDQIVLLIESVLNARKRVLMVLNVGVDDLERVVDVLPCMRQPTVSPLQGSSGYAVTVAVPRSDLPVLIPAIKECGGTDIIVSSPSQIVP